MREFLRISFQQPFDLPDPALSQQVRAITFLRKERFEEYRLGIIAPSLKAILDYRVGLYKAALGKVSFSSPENFQKAYQADMEEQPKADLNSSFFEKAKRSATSFVKVVADTAREKWKGDNWGKTKFEQTFMDFVEVLSNELKEFKLEWDPENKIPRYRWMVLLNTLLHFHALYILDSRPEIMAKFKNLIEEYFPVSGRDTEKSATIWQEYFATSYEELLKRSGETFTQEDWNTPESIAAAELKNEQEAKKIEAAVKELGEINSPKNPSSPSEEQPVKRLISSKPRKAKIEQGSRRRVRAPTPKSEIEKVTDSTVIENLMPNQSTLFSSPLQAEGMLNSNAESRPPSPSVPLGVLGEGLSDLVGQSSPPPKLDSQEEVASSSDESTQVLDQDQGDSPLLSQGSILKNEGFTPHFDEFATKTIMAKNAQFPTSEEGLKSFFDIQEALESSAAEEFEERASSRARLSSQQEALRTKFQAFLKEGELSSEEALAFRLALSELLNKNWKPFLEFMVKYRSENVSFKYTLENVVRLFEAYLLPLAAFSEPLCKLVFSEELHNALLSHIPSHFQGMSMRDLCNTQVEFIADTLGRTLLGLSVQTEEVLGYIAYALPKIEIIDLTEEELAPLEESLLEEIQVAPVSPIKEPIADSDKEKAEAECEPDVSPPLQEVLADQALTLPEQRSLKLIELLDALESKKAEDILSFPRDSIFKIPTGEEREAYFCRKAFSEKFDLEGNEEKKDALLRQLVRIRMEFSVKSFASLTAQQKKFVGGLNPLINVLDPMHKKCESFIKEEERHFEIKRKSQALLEMGIKEVQRILSLNSYDIFRSLIDKSSNLISEHFSRAENEKSFEEARKSFAKTLRPQFKKLIKEDEVLNQNKYCDLGDRFSTGLLNALLIVGSLLCPPVAIFRAAYRGSKHQPFLFQSVRVERAYEIEEGVINRVAEAARDQQKAEVQVARAMARASLS